MSGTRRSFSKESESYPHGSNSFNSWTVPSSRNPVSEGYVNSRHVIWETAPVTTRRELHTDRKGKRSIIRDCAHRTPTKALNTNILENFELMSSEEIARSNTPEIDLNNGDNNLKSNDVFVRGILNLPEPDQSKAVYSTEEPDEDKLGIIPLSDPEVNWNNYHTDSHYTNVNSLENIIDETPEKNNVFERGPYNPAEIGEGHGKVIYSPQEPEETPEEIHFDEDKLRVIPLTKPQTSSGNYLDASTNDNKKRNEDSSTNFLGESSDNSNVFKRITITKGGPYNPANIDSSSDIDTNPAQDSVQGNFEEDRLRVIPLTKLRSKY